MSHTLLRLPAVKARSGYSRSTVYLRISEGLWTRPVALGARAVAWPEQEVDALLAARIRGASAEQIRSLVDSLRDKRQTLALA